MKCLKVETFEIFLQPHSLLTFSGVVKDLGDYFDIHNLVKMIKLNDITDSLGNSEDIKYNSLNIVSAASTTLRISQYMQIQWWLIPGFIYA